MKQIDKKIKEIEKRQKDRFDPLGDNMASVLVVMLTVAIVTVVIATTKYVYEGGGTWAAIGWILGWISCFILAKWSAKHC
jgi:hypothetical protein